MGSVAGTGHRSRRLRQVRTPGQVQHADDPEGLLLGRRVGALSATPLVVTAHFDADCFAALNALRTLHFPAALNRVPAHISLFHHLPGEHQKQIVNAVRVACATLAPFDLEPEGWKNLGRGVAARYHSAELERLHQCLSREWSHWLTAQDRQALRPHVTIQNKVTSAEARALFDEMRGQQPLPACRLDGLSIWRYLGGPWQRVADCFFGRRAQ